MKNLRISLDIDDTIASFAASFDIRFPNSDWSDSSSITKKVLSLKHDKFFWENLPLLESINFEPENYCTKRINSKVYTKNWLKTHGFPNKPIYQMYYQHGNKADLIKGRCDVLIDDSVSNVIKAINSGLPALIIDRPHNQTEEPLFRIYSLDIDEIKYAYELELYTLGWN